MVIASAMIIRSAESARGMGEHQQTTLSEGYHEQAHHAVMILVMKFMGCMMAHVYGGIA